MKPLFPNRSYDTPDNYPRRLRDRLALNTRLYFAYEYLAEIIRSALEARNGRYDTEEWALSSFRIFRLLESCGGRFHIRGLDNLEKCRKPAIFISNHMSALETFVFPAIIAPFMELTFIVKDSLVTHPIFGPVMRSRDPIVVGRKNAREDFQKVMTGGKERLAKGISIVVFPQSTRTVEFIPEEFNSLGVKLAKSAGVEIVPVAIRTDFWENGKVLRDLGPLKRNRPIHIVFGGPLTVQGNGKEEHKAVVEFIIAHLRQWNSPVRIAREIGGD